MNSSMKSALVRTMLMIGVIPQAHCELFAQYHRIDSLKEKLSTTPKTKSFEITFELAREYFDFDEKKALEYSKKANTIAYLTKDSLGIVKSFRLMGQMYRRLNYFDSSVYYFQKCLPLAERLHSYEETHYILNGIGVTFGYQAKYDESLHYHLKALNIASAKNDSARIYRSLFNLGFVYYKLSNYRTALEYYSRSLQMKIATNDLYDLDLMKANISLCYAFLGKTDEARKMLKPLLDRCATNCDENSLIFIHYASGLIWYKAGNVMMAERDFLKSYSIAKKKGDTRYVYDNIIYLSKVFQRKNNFHLAERFLKEGESLTIASPFDFEEIKLYEEFCALYAIKRDYKKLSHYREKYIQLKDSVFNEKHTNNLMRLHAEAAEKENIARLASQEQRMHLKQEIIVKQRGINVLISLGVVLLAVLIYILFRIQRDRKMANVQLNKKVAERTLELEHNFEDLAQAMKHRDLTLDRFSNDLNNSLQSMRAQCCSGIEGEINPESHKYFEEIEITTARLEKSLENILTEPAYNLTSTA